MSRYRYLLTTGETTTNPAEYIIDLFNIYLTLYPGDIPHRKNLGFDFIFTGVTKDGLEEEVKSKVNRLITKIQDSLSSDKYTITVDTLDLIDEETVKLVINVNGTLSDDIYINI